MSDDVFFLSSLCYENKSLYFFFFFKSLYFIYATSFQRTSVVVTRICPVACLWSTSKPDSWHSWVEHLQLFIIKCFSGESVYGCTWQRAGERVTWKDGLLGLYMFPQDRPATFCGSVFMFICETQDWRREMSTFSLTSVLVMSSRTSLHTTLPILSQMHIWKGSISWEVHLPWWLELGRGRDLLDRVKADGLSLPALACDDLATEARSSSTFKPSKFCLLAGSIRSSGLLGE